MENLSNISVIRDVLSRHGFSFSKGLGQNFLINPTVCPRMAEMGNAQPGWGMIEIGAGVGVLTAELAQRADKVVCIEIDSRLLPILDETLAEYDNIKIVNQDVLKVDLHKLIAEEFPNMPVAVCANLPYYITTPIIMDLLENERKVDTITVMVQKEVAERMQAGPGDKEYGALSIAVQYYCDAHLDMIVQPSCFMPRPKVASAVITLKVLPERKIAAKDEELFFHLVKCAFGQRRKTLLNCLFNQGNLGFSKEEWTEILTSLGWDPRVRGEALSIEDFAKLTDAVFEAKQNQ